MNKRLKQLHLKALRGPTMKCKMPDGTIVELRRGLMFPPYIPLYVTPDPQLDPEPFDIWRVFNEAIKRIYAKPSRRS